MPILLLAAALALAGAIGAGIAWRRDVTRFKLVRATFQEELAAYEEQLTEHNSRQAKRGNDEWRTPQPPQKPKTPKLASASKWYAFGLLAAVVLLVIAASSTIIGPKEMGVVTEFGRPIDAPLSSGFHFKKPWAKVVTLDAALQTESRKDNDTDEDTTCTNVRIGNQSIACVNNSTQWRIERSEANSLYQNFKEDDKIRDNLVMRAQDAALNAVFATYDPLSTLDSEDPQAAKGSELDKLGDLVAKRLQVMVGDQIVIQDVVIPLVNFDEATQKQINRLQTEKANTRTATQSRLTAEQVAQANEKLADSISNDPNVLVSKCLDTLNAMVDKAQPVPAGFNCWPGGSSAIVVPQATPAK